MNTFFEKLTGVTAKTEDVEVEAASSGIQQSVVRRAPVRKSGPKQVEAPHHLDVDAKDEGVGRPEISHDDEGELTVDIYDKGDEIVIQSTVAGVKPEDLDVSITNDTVTVQGKRQRVDEVSEENYYYKELFWGTFSRSVILPEEIDEDLADASLKHGLLTVRLPKKKKGVVQKLKVKVT
jgi:HSP20 family protein